MVHVETWRPEKGGPVPLTDQMLAKIGLAVVFESGAKTAAAGALKVVEQLCLADWVKLERVQFKQITDRLIRASSVDAELNSRVAELETARQVGHEQRHTVVHSSWGEGDVGAVAYDFGRARKLTESDIDEALAACAELKRAAHWTVLRCGELIAEGVFPEGLAAESRMSVYVRDRFVKL